MATEAHEKAVAARAEPRRDLTGRAFEAVCAKMLEERGFQVATTKATADGGVDIVAVSDRPFQKGTYLVQCKDWTGPVGEPVLRELYGLVVAERAVKGVIVTSSCFTDKAREFALGKQLELVDGEQLRELVPGLTFEKPQLPRAAPPPKDWKADLGDGEAYAMRALRRLDPGMSPGGLRGQFPLILADLREAQAADDVRRRREIESEIELALADLAEALALGMPQRLWDPANDFWCYYEFECKEDEWRASLLKTRAFVYDFVGRLDEAIADCNGILYLGGGSSARNIRANCYLNKGLYQQALEDYVWLRQYSPLLFGPTAESPAQRESRQNYIDALERAIRRCQEAIAKEEDKGA
jgi:hypothetical protein